MVQRFLCLLLLVFVQGKLIGRHCRRELNPDRLFSWQRREQGKLKRPGLWNGSMEQRCWKSACFTGSISLPRSSPTADPSGQGWRHSAATWRTVIPLTCSRPSCPGWQGSMLRDCGRILPRWTPCLRREPWKMTAAGLTPLEIEETHLSTFSCSTWAGWFRPISANAWIQVVRKLSPRLCWKKPNADSTGLVWSCFSLYWERKDSWSFSSGFSAILGRQLGPRIQRRLAPRRIDLQEDLDLGKRLRPSKWRPTHRFRHRYRRRGLSKRAGASRLLLSWIFKRLAECCELCTVLLAIPLAATVSQHKQPPANTHTPNNIVGRPGPKSRGRLNPQLSFLHLIIWSSLLLQPSRAVQSTDTRVGGSPHLDPPEVLYREHSRLQGSTNHHGVSGCIEQRTGRKRAFLRAQKRAARSGGTRYRGRWYNAAELGVQHDPKLPRTRQPQRSASGRRLAFLSWNASGLTIDRHKELQTWLLTPEGSRVDLVAIQETHWKGQLELQLG